MLLRAVSGGFSAAVAAELSLLDFPVHVFILLLALLLLVSGFTFLFLLLVHFF